MPSGTVAATTGTTGPDHDAQEWTRYTSSTTSEKRGPLNTGRMSWSEVVHDPVGDEGTEVTGLTVTLSRGFPQGPVLREDGRGRVGSCGPGGGVTVVLLRERNVPIPFRPRPRPRVETSNPSPHTKVKDPRSATTVGKPRNRVLGVVRLVPYPLLRLHDPTVRGSGPVVSGPPGVGEWVRSTRDSKSSWTSPGQSTGSLCLHGGRRSVPVGEAGPGPLFVEDKKVSWYLSKQEGWG